MELFLKKANGESMPLYTVATTNSREAKAYVSIHTWDKAIEIINSNNYDIDDENYWRKVVKYSIDEKYGRAEIEYVETHKGWGYDYIVNISVDRAYCFD